MVSLPIRDFQVNANVQLTVTGFINPTLLIRSMTVSGRRPSVTNVPGPTVSRHSHWQVWSVIALEAKRKYDLIEHCASVD